MAGPCAAGVKAGAWRPLRCFAADRQARSTESSRVRAPPPASRVAPRTPVLLRAASAIRGSRSRPAPPVRRWRAPSVVFKPRPARTRALRAAGQAVGPENRVVPVGRRSPRGAPSARLGKPARGRTPAMSSERRRSPKGRAAIRRRCRCKRLPRRTASAASPARATEPLPPPGTRARHPRLKENRPRHPGALPPAQAEQGRVARARGACADSRRSRSNLEERAVPRIYWAACRGPHRSR